MTYIRKDLDRLHCAAADATLELMPRTPPWLDAVAWMWAAKYMLDGDKVDRFLADSYCAEYLLDLKAGQVRYP